MEAGKASRGPELENSGQGSTRGCASDPATWLDRGRASLPFMRPALPLLTLFHQLLSKITRSRQCKCRVRYPQSCGDSPRMHPHRRIPISEQRSRFDTHALRTRQLTLALSSSRFKDFSPGAIAGIVIGIVVVLVLLVGLLWALIRRRKRRAQVRDRSARARAIALTRVDGANKGKTRDDNGEDGEPWPEDGKARVQDPPPGQGACATM